VPTEAKFYCFRSGELVALESDENEVKLSAADSWLVEDGRVRSLQSHFNRFTDAVQQVSPEHLQYLPDFFAAVTEKLPRSGRWFPRVEIHCDESVSDHLHFRLREAPEQLTEARLWTLDETDPRSNPRIKGPDLSLGQQLRRRANLHGADEAVLLDVDGFVLEGALSSLVWWRGDVLCAPGDDVAWLPSVTRDQVLAIAEQSGYETRFEYVRPEELAGLEIWALSALHGIRVVTEWNDLPVAPAKATHVDAFNRRLRLLSASLD
jgi:branched-subunit amino acid aminotransferase/4-amino-4-deoxychorismate lyase